MKNKAIKSKKESITKLLLVIISMTLVAITVLAVFILIDENGYFAPEQPDSGSELDTNAISLSYLDSNNVFTYPLEFSEKDLISTQILGSNVCILTSTALICLNDDGEFLFYERLNYSSPVLVTSENFGIVYDEIGGSYITFDEKKVVYESKIDSSETFLFAKVDEDKNTLLVTKSSSKSSIFYLYDSNNELVRSFGFNQDYVVDMSIYNSDKLLFLTIGSDSGYLESKIYLCDMDSDEVLTSYSLGEETVISVDFINSSSFSVLTSSYVMLGKISDDNLSISSQNEIQGQLLNFYKSESGLVIASQELNELNQTQISLYNDDLTLSSMINIPYKAVDIYADSKFVYVLTAQVVYIINSSGEIHTQIELTDSVSGIISSSSGVYYYSVGVLHKNNYKLST